MPSEDSYINANNLTAIELANLINRLTNDENEYNQYFAFKNRPISKSFQQIALMSYTHPNVLCRLCEYVNKQTYQNI